MGSDCIVKSTKVFIFAFIVDPIFLQVQRLQSQIGAYFEEMWSFLSPHIEVLETIAAAYVLVVLCIY